MYLYAPVYHSPSKTQSQLPRPLHNLTMHQQPSTATSTSRCRGPKRALRIVQLRQLYFSHHNLPFIPYSRQHSAGETPARTAWVEGSLLLAPRKMRWRPGDTCLSNASCELCPGPPALSIFSGSIEEPSRNPTSVRARSLTGVPQPL